MNRDEELAKLHKAVFDFANLMKEKLLEKYELGWHGWDDSYEKDAMRQSLLGKAQQLYNGDYSQAVDVANYSMFLYLLTHEVNPDGRPPVVPL